MEKRRKRLFVFIAIIILIVAVFSLPSLISSTRGKEFVLRQINKRIPGELTVDNWTLRWLGDIEIQNLSFHDENGLQVLNLQGVSINRGLINLIVDHNNLGNIILTKPLISVPHPPQTATERQGDTHTFKGSVADMPKREDSPVETKTREKNLTKPASKKEFLFPPLRGTITIEDGALQLLSSRATNQSVIEDLSIGLSIDGPANPITFQLRCTAGGADNVCEGSGTLSLPESGVLDLDQIKIDIKFKAANIDLNPLSIIAATYSDTPEINGILNANISVTGNMTDGLDIANTLSMNALEISAENAALGDIHVDLHAHATKTSLNLKRAFIKSDFCNINASGKYGETGGGAVTANADVDIATTLRLLKGMGIVTNAITCTGNLRATLNGTSHGQIIDIKQADIKVSDIKFKSPDGTFKQDELALSTMAVINLKKRQVNIPVATIKTSFGTVNLDSLHIGDWEDLPVSLKTSLKTEIDIKSMLTTLTDFIQLPKGLEVSGGLNADISIDLSGVNAFKIEFNASAPQLTVHSKEPPLDIEDNPSISLLVSASPTLDTFEIVKASLTSSIMDADLTARLQNYNDKGTLAINGSLAPNLTELSRYMKVYADIPVTLSGKKAEPFDFRTEWIGYGDNLQLTSLSGKAGIFIEEINGFGFHVLSLTVPVTIDKNGVYSKISAKVNNGQLTLAPCITLLNNSSTVLMPTNTFILKDIQMTTEIANELLGLVNPVFRGITTVSGTMSFYMDNFSWPLSEDEMPARSFNGKLIFTDVKMTSDGLLNDLLDLAKVRNREMLISNVPIDIVCANGVITSSPLHLKVKEYELNILGTVGLDDTLNYQAQIPITEELVGKSVYKYLEGTSLNIPIKGTIQKPILNLKSFGSALGDIIQQAASKALSKELEHQLQKLFE